MASCSEDVSLPIETLEDVLSMLSKAEECYSRQEYTTACRLLETIKKTAHSQKCSIDWKLSETEDLLKKCTMFLGKTYFQLKLYKNVVSLIEKFIWNKAREDGDFFVNAALLINTYMKLEETINAFKVSVIVEQYLNKHDFNSKEDEIQILVSIVKAQVKHPSQSKVLVSHCDRILHLTRDGHFQKERIIAFMSKATAYVDDNNAIGGLVFADQAVALAKSNQAVKSEISAEAQLLSVEIRLKSSKYEDALNLLNDVIKEARQDSSHASISKIHLAHTLYLAALCRIKLNEHLDKCNRNEISRELKDASKLALSAKTMDEQSLLINIWDQITEVYQSSPDFVQLEHGHKCMLQVLSGGIAKLLASVEACETVPPSLVFLIYKASRLLLKLECSLADPKMAIETIEWARNSLILSKIPTRRLLKKLYRPLTYSWLEQLLNRFPKTSLFLYFADIGKDESQTLCLWAFVPGQGCILFSKLPTVADGSSLIKVLFNLLHGFQPDSYVSERRLLPWKVTAKESFAKTGPTETTRALLIKLGSLLFSRVANYLMNIDNIYIFPDGPLLALSSLFEKIFNLWYCSRPSDTPWSPKKVCSLPSILFLEICLENEVATWTQTEQHDKKLLASKLGGLHTFFKQEKAKNSFGDQKLSQGNIKAKPLQRPKSVKLAVGAHTVSTLTTQSSSGADICTSNIYALASPNSHISTKKAIFLGNPVMPSDGLSVYGTVWKLPELISAQKEILSLSKQIRSSNVFLAEQCTKEQFLRNCSDAALIHFATYISYADGIVAFSYPALGPKHDSNDDRNFLSPSTISGSKLIIPEIACLPLTTASLVAISSCQSVIDIVNTLEFSNNHIANSTYMLPAAFLLAGAHSVVIPQLGLTDKQVTEAFSKLYTTKELIGNPVKRTGSDESSALSVIGVGSLTDLKRISHAMLDQEIKKAIDQVNADHLKTSEENDIFICDLNNMSAANEPWLVKMKWLVHWMAKSCPPLIDIQIVSVILENAFYDNEVLQIPDMKQLQQLLIWLGFHVIYLDKQLTLSLSPLKNSPHTMAKMLLMLEVLVELFYTDAVLGEMMVDVTESLTQDHTADFINFLSVVKHTTLQIEITDKTAARLFENPRHQALFHMIGFSNFLGSILFRASPENCKRMEVAFKFFTALSYSQSNEILQKFILNENDVTKEEKLPLLSLNYKIAPGPIIAGTSEFPLRRVIATEPSFRHSAATLGKSEINTKINLAQSIGELKRETTQSQSTAKNNLDSQMAYLETLAPTIHNRKVSNLPNKVTSDHVKVYPGSTPSYIRHSINFVPPVDVATLNDERARLDKFYLRTTNQIKASQRRKIENLVEKHINS